MASEEGWKQLHPASIAVNLVPRAWRLLRAAWPVFLALLFGTRNDPSGVLDLGVVLLFFASAVGSTFVHWATLRYRVACGRLEIQSGLLDRKTRVIDPRRIQNVERVRNVFHRLAGLSEVRIETASGREVEGMLSALSSEAAEALVQALEVARRAVGAAEETEEEAERDVLVHNSPGELFTYGATAARLGAGAVVVAGVMSEALQWVAPTETPELSSALAGGAAVVFVIGVISGTWILGTATALIRHWGFELFEQRGGLVASEGLLTQRRVELPLDKIQLVRVHEPLLRRLLGFGSVQIETAAAREMAGGTVMVEAMAPVVHRDAMGALVARTVPGVTSYILVRTLRPPHPRALTAGLLGSGARVAPFVVAAAWWLGPWGLLALFAFPLAFGAAWLDFRFQGWSAEGPVVIGRQGYLDRRTAVVPRDKIQSLEVRQGPIRRWLGLGRLVVRVAGSRVRLPELGWEEVIALQERLARPSARTPTG